MIRVRQFFRKPLPGYFSIERLFEQVRQELPGEIDCSVWVAPEFSRGFLPRVRSAWMAARAQADVNHITGDINFISLGMKPERTILTWHDVGRLSELWPGRLRGWPLWFFWHKVPEWRANWWTAISESTKQDLVRMLRVDPSRIHVIPNPVDPRIAAAPKPAMDEMPRVLFVGTFPNKNLERVICALKGIRCHLRIVGELHAAKRKALGEAKVSYSNVSGLTDDELREEYQASDLLLFPSLHEGFGLPIVEAQATGRPVVTSCLGATKATAGGGACLVDPHSVEDIRRGVIQVLESADYRSGLIEVGFENVKRFQVSCVAAKYAQLYRTVADGYSA